MSEIDWGRCVAGTYSQYNARAKATLFKPSPGETTTLTLWGGRRLLVNNAPAFEIEYVGAVGTYKRSIDVLDICQERPWLFEAWCHSISELHTYAFHKVVKITEVGTGKSITGEEMRELFGGAAPCT